MIFALMLGGITHHYIGHSLDYCNRLNNIGTIQNDYVVLMVGDNEKKFGFIKGRDSVCADILGPISSFVLADNVDLVLGGYNTNRSEFNERNIIPPSLFGITPIVGVNFKVPIYRNIEINNLVSFGIISHAISYTF